MAFDFADYKRAVEDKDADRWASFYLDEAVWVEYRHTNPPRAPNVMSGCDTIRAFIARICSQPLQLVVEEELVTADRAAFRLTVTLADKSRIIEHIMIDFPIGKISRQVDVEAWD